MLFKINSCLIILVVSIGGFGSIIAAADNPNNEKPGRYKKFRLPNTLDGSFRCPERSNSGSEIEVSEISPRAEAIFFGTVKSIVKRSDTKVSLVEVRSSWKGVNSGEVIELLSPSAEWPWPNSPQVGGKFFILASGKPLIWRKCTFVVDASEYSEEKIASVQQKWTKWTGLKPSLEKK